MTSHRTSVPTRGALDGTPSRSEPLARLLGPAGEELTCEECFEQLDRYVELDLSGREADEVVPGMRAHLEGCPACREDYASLTALLDAESWPIPQ